MPSLPCNHSLVVRTVNGACSACAHLHVHLAQIAVHPIRAAAAAQVRVVGKHTIVHLPAGKGGRRRRQGRNRAGNICVCDVRIRGGGGGCRPERQRRRLRCQVSRQRVRRLSSSLTRPRWKRWSGSGSRQGCALPGRAKRMRRARAKGLPCRVPARSQAHRTSGCWSDTALHIPGFLYVSSSPACAYTPMLSSHSC